MDGTNSPTDSETGRLEDNLPLSELQAKIRMAEIAWEREKLAEESKIREKEREKEYIEREKDRALEREKIESVERLQREKWVREAESTTWNTYAGQEPPEIERKRREYKNIFVQPIKDNSDPEIIFSVFERTARIQKIDTENYMEYIQPALTERSLRIFSKLSEVQARDYFAVKEAILDAFHLTPEDHLIKFRSAKIKPDENYSQFLERISDHFSSWIEGEGAGDDIGKLRNIIVREQYLKYFPAELKIYLVDRDAKELNEIAKLADKYESARRINRPSFGDTRYVREGFRTGGNLRNNENYSRKPEIGKELKISERTTWRPQIRERQIKEEMGKRPMGDITCFKCHKKGHLSTTCPDRINGGRTERRTEPKQVYFVALTNLTIPQRYARQVIINGNVCTAYRDTGAEISLVKPELVLENQWTGASINLVTATGETKKVPTAKVKWLTSGREITVEVAVIRALPFDCLIANDIGEDMQAVMYETEQKPSGEYGKCQNRATENPYEQKMVVQGKYLTVKRDTGSQISMVNAELVAPSDYEKGAYREVKMLNGKIKKLPLAKIKINQGGEEEKIKVAVCEKVPFNLLLANDVGYDMRPIKTLVVLTRGAKKNAELQIGQKNDGVDNNKPEKEQAPPADRERDSAPGQSSSLTPITTFSLGTDVKTQPEMAAIFDKLATVTDRSDFKKAQEGDSTLNVIREKIIANKKTGNNAGDPQFDSEDGLLYRKWLCKKTNESFKQIIVPKELREPIMFLCHQNPLSGHMAYRKSHNRISKEFFWPGIIKDLRKYVAGCEHCQRSRRSIKGLKVPLCNVPIITQVWLKISVDLVGPLPVTEEGNKFLLTVMDHASNYPEAVALANTDTKTVIDSLIEIFTRWGFPQQILSDLGKQFTSDVIHGLWQRTGVRVCHTSAYRPESNGRLERVHASLKHMLRTLAEQHDQDWDKMVPYALFAFREVPGESTGYSPFELVYGHDVRGPTDILRRAWAGEADEKKAVTTYLKEFRTRIYRTAKMVQKNKQEAQKKMKTWYDRKARSRVFEAGQQVLALRPVVENSMDIAWDGPFKILRRVGDLNYEVQIDSARSISKIYHINMLKPFEKRNPFVGWLGCGVQEQEGNSVEIDMWPTSEKNEMGRPEIGASLSDQEKAELEGMFSQYGDVLRNTPGRTHLETHDIELSESTPVCRKQYRNPWSVRQEINNQVKEMLEMDIIEASRSKYASPVILVPKADGTARFVVDFRGINKITKFDAYPNSNLSESLAGLGRARYLTKIDLVRGYWQIPLSDSAKEITAFRTETGLFQFKVMPFGLKNSSASFVRLMDQVLEGLSEYTRYYVDDLLIFSNKWEDHVKHIKKVMTRLREAGLTAKPSKCHFGVNSVEYLGFKIGPEGISPKEAKVKAITDWPRPVTKRHVRAFLGVTGYYRQHIPNYSEKAMALTDLTKKTEPNNVVWTEGCEKAFKTLKECLSKSPVLASPDFTKEFTLQTDASDRGLGAVLCQTGQDEQAENPIAYFSRKLNSAEQGYATIEKEALAIVWGVEKARAILYGRHFTIVSDHNPLIWMENFKGKNRKILRWVLQLQEYDFNLKYRQGKANSNADGLSRQI